MSRTEQSERYERYAAECLRLAQNATDPAERASLLHLAEEWRRLANGEEISEPDPD